MAEKRLYATTVIPGASSSAAEVPSSRIYRGMSTVGNPFNGFSLFDIDLIKQDIINHFHIRQGEKLSDPSFGCIIWDLLFDPLTPDLKDAIAKNVSEIVNYDPRVNADNITVSEYGQGIQVECELTYLPHNISESLRFRFDQDNNILQ